MGDQKQRKMSATPTKRKRHDKKESTPPPTKEANYTPEQSSELDLIALQTSAQQNCNNGSTQPYEFGERQPREHQPRNLANRMNKVAENPTYSAPVKNCGELLRTLNAKETRMNRVRENLYKKVKTKDCTFDQWVFKD